MPFIKKKKLKQESPRLRFLREARETEYHALYEKFHKKSKTGKEDEKALSEKSDNKKRIMTGEE